MSNTYSSVWVPTLKGAFLSRYEGGVGGMWASSVANLNTITTEQGKYVELSSAGTVRPWVGNRLETEPVAMTMTLTNVPYEGGFSISEEDVRRDNIGMYERWSQEMADKYADHWNALTAALLI